MGLDWLSKGEVIRSVKRIREIGEMGNGPTNYVEWDTVVDTLGGKTLGFKGIKVDSIYDVKRHLKDGGAAIVAVDYGTYRRVRQSKAGSLTFDGYHAILFVGWRWRNGNAQTRSFDSLLDGRYRGCPSGPVWVNWGQVRKGSDIGGRAFALNLIRDPKVADIDFAEERAATSLVDVLSDIYGAGREDIALDLEDLLGITYAEDTDQYALKDGINLE